MKIIIEKDIWDNESDLIKASHKAGMEVFLATYNWSSPKDQNRLSITKPNCDLVDIGTHCGNNIFKDEDLVFYGSIALARWFNTNTRWKVWIPNKVFDWNYYVTKFRGFLLNSYYVIIPFGDIFRYVRRTSYNKIFIKPMSGYKSFTGQCFETKDLMGELRHIAQSENIFPEELCVVAEGQALGDEYRFLIKNNKVVTGTQYLPTEKLIKANNQAWTAAQYIVDMVSYQPDIHEECPLWTLDLVEYKEAFKVLEVNSFSCAATYAMDCDLIVQAIRSV